MSVRLSNEALEAAAVSAANWPSDLDGTMVFWKDRPEEKIYWDSIPVTAENG